MSDGSVGTTGGENNDVRTHPTIVQREDNVDRRDPVNARAQAIREQVAVFESQGLDVPDHLRQLASGLSEPEARMETRADVPVHAKGTAKKSPNDEGTGYFFEDGHGVEPKHPDSTDKEGYHVARPDNAPGAGELPDYPQGEMDSVEPVEKYPDFANPGKKGNEIPQAAHDRGIVPDSVEVAKTFEQVAKEREEQRELVHQGKPTDPEKALNPTPKRGPVKKAAPNAPRSGK